MDKRETIGLMAIAGVLTAVMVYSIVMALPALITDTQKDITNIMSFLNKALTNGTKAGNKSGKQWLYDPSEDTFIAVVDARGSCSSRVFDWDGAFIAQDGKSGLHSSAYFVNEADGTSCFDGCIALGGNLPTINLVDTVGNGSIPETFLRHLQAPASVIKAHGEYLAKGADDEESTPESRTLDIMDGKAPATPQVDVLAKHAKKGSK
jgi:hypothetical protein